MNPFIKIENFILESFPLWFSIIFCIELYIGNFYPATILIVVIYIYLYILHDYNNYYGIAGLYFLSIPSVTFLSFTIFIAIPSIYIFNIETDLSKYNYLISIYLFYLLIPFGYLFGQFIFKTKINSLENFKNPQPVYNFNFLSFRMNLLIIVIGLVGLYIFRSNTFPLLEIVQNPGDYFKASLIREEALKTLKISKIEKYLFNWLRNLIIPLLVISSLIISKLKHNKIFTPVSLLILFLSVFINSITLEKSPVAALFLSIFGMLFLFRNYLKLRHLFVSIITILSIPIFIMTLLFWGRPDIFYVIFVSLMNRIFIIPSEVLFQYFKIFPNQHPFLNGNSTNLFSWFTSIGDSTFPLTNYVAKIWWNIEFTTGSANTVFLGNFWAEFGWFGIIFSIIIVGFILHITMWIILESVNYKFNYTYILLSSICLPIFIFNFFSSNITTIFFTRGLIILLLSMVFIIIKKRNIFV